MNASRVLTSKLSFEMGHDGFYSNAHDGWLQEDASYSHSTLRDESATCPVHD